MACVSGEKEIEGISEKVSRMNKKKDKLDDLLKRNITKQLADIDWDDLNAAISGRLDKMQQTRQYAFGLPVWFKISAVTAAAAVLIIVMIASSNKKGSATITFINPSDRTRVQVNTVERDTKRDKCEVRIIDLSTTRKQEDKTRPNWFIISQTESVSTNNGLDRDMRDIACLF